MAISNAQVSRVAARSVPWTRRALLAAFAALIACSFALAQAPAAEPRDRVHVVVLHTNDMHGQVLPRKATWVDKEIPPLAGGLPRVAAHIAKVRAACEAEGAGVLCLDGGDWYQGTPEGAVDHGLPMARVIAAVGYDAVSIGNHEFDHGLANLKRLLAEARPPALCANVRDLATSARLPNTEPWNIVDVRGLRVALVGLLTPSTPSITHPDAKMLVFDECAATVAGAKRALEGRYDLLVPLGHIGVDEGIRVARTHPDLALIVTGHSHAFLDSGVREGSTLIVQAGAKAQVVGRADLWFDRERKRVVESSARLDQLFDEPAAEHRNAAVEALCDQMIERAAEGMRQVVGELSAPLRGGKGPWSTVAGSWVADLMRARTGADVAFHNRGGIRAEIQAGRVTRRDVFEVLPFDNDVVTVVLRGAVLEGLVRRSIEGSSHSGLDYSGLVAHVRPREEGGRTRLTLVKIDVGGAPLERERSYRVTTNSFLAGGGDGFVELAEAQERATDPILLRDLATEAFERAVRVDPPQDARILEVKE
jgi:2',3'-cyclic-nucleotide 2'-phosphodiesterase (5'-nucleotidase family)